MDRERIRKIHFKSGTAQPSVQITANEMGFWEDCYSVLEKSNLKDQLTGQDP